MAESIRSAHLQNSLSTDYMDSNGQAIDVDNHHSIAHNTEQISTTSTDEECSSHTLVVPGQVPELTDDSAQQNKCSIAVNKHHVVEATGSWGSSRTNDDGVTLPHKIARKSRSSFTHQKKHPCTVCGAKFRSAKYVRYHMRIHTGEKPFSCSFCDVKFRWKKARNTHELRHKNVPHKIPQKSHSVLSRPKKHECTECGARFHFPKEVRYHMRIHTGEKPFSCSFCDMKFRLKYFLQLHERRHKNEFPQCDLCGGRYVNVRAHMRTVHSAASHKHTCSVCQKGFRLQCKLNRHMLTHSDERPYTCQDCGGRYKSVDDLKTHMAIHTREKNHACVVCGKKFLGRGQVNVHMLGHTGEKPHACETCGRSFRVRVQLTNHQRTHTKEKPYVCSTCGKAFGKPTGLSRHELIHSGVQPYECSVCGMRFNQSSSMQRHMLTHTGEKPYSCSDCGQRFTQSGGLASHRRRHCAAKQPTDVIDGDALKQ